MNDIEITTTPRGFHRYGTPVATAYGHTVEVYESSAASGPHVWMSVEPGETLDAGCVHLNEEQVRALMARFQVWLDEIPTRWGTGERA